MSTSSLYVTINSQCLQYNADTASNDEQDAIIYNKGCGRCTASFLCHSEAKGDVVRMLYVKECSRPDHFVRMPRPTTKTIQIQRRATEGTSAPTPTPDPMTASRRSLHHGSHGGLFYQTPRPHARTVG